MGDALVASLYLMGDCLAYMCTHSGCMCTTVQGGRGVMQCMCSPGWICRIRVFTFSSSGWLADRCEEASVRVLEDSVVKADCTAHVLQLIPGHRPYTLPDYAALT